MTAHTMRVEIEDGSLHFRVQCPYADGERTPDAECWPRDEDGEPYPEGDRTVDECNYIGWCENLTPDEWHKGLITLVFDAKFVWDGDAPRVVLLDPREVDRMILINWFLDTIDWPTQKVVWNREFRTCADCGEVFFPKREHQIRCVPCAAANA